MNLLSIGGAYGVVVAVFQWGWLGDLFDLDRTYLIASPMPIIFFAVLFGLSMDYEVFLLSRIREEYDATGDNAEVWLGTAASITSAALIMTVVFGELQPTPRRWSRCWAWGCRPRSCSTRPSSGWCWCPRPLMAVRWWLPSWLDRRLPHVRMEDADVPGQPEPVLVSIPERG